MRAVDELRGRFGELGIAAGTPVVAYCGSGRHRLPRPARARACRARTGRLYPGSWSQWAGIRRGRSRPVRTALSGVARRQSSTFVHELRATVFPWTTRHTRSRPPSRGAERRAVAGAAHPGAVRGPPPPGDGAALHGRVRPHEGRRHLSLRGLRAGSVHLRDQVRFRQRLAELLSSRRSPRTSRSAPTTATAWSAPRSSASAAAAISAMCSTMGRTDRPALLHQLLRARVRPGGLTGTGNARRAGPAVAGPPASTACSAARRSRTLK